MKKLVDYVKKTMRCVGYRDYVVAELEKLEKIEQIVNEWYDLSFIKTAELIKEVLDKELH